MRPHKTTNDDDWPESSETFGYSRARKRHVVKLEGFLDRIQSEGEGDVVRTDNVSLGISNFSVEFPSTDLNLRVAMDVQIKPKRLEILNNKQITKGPWLVVILRGLEATRHNFPGFKIFCNLVVLFEDGSKLQLLQNNDYNFKNTGDLKISSIEVDIAKIEAIGDQILPDGVLTILCEMECGIYKSLYVGGGDHESKPNLTNSKSSTNDLPGKLPGPSPLTVALNDSEFSDVLVEVLGSTSEKPTKKNLVVTKKFYCHKVILATQSAVFAELLKEKSTRAGTKTSTLPAMASVTIRNVDYATVLKMLTYIYHGQIFEGECDEKLYEAAKLYQIEGLIQLCEFFNANKD